MMSYPRRMIDEMKLFAYDEKGYETIVGRHGTVS